MNYLFEKFVVYRSWIDTSIAKEPKHNDDSHASSIRDTTSTNKGKLTYWLEGEYRDVEACEMSAGLSNRITSLVYLGEELFLREKDGEITIFDRVTKEIWLCSSI